jgi:FkbM family methyltransferase
VTIVLRNISRALGINRVVGGLLSSRGYEDRFQKAMLEAIQSGDCVWDIGANVGLYTSKFADIVGSSGSVYAFEPSPKNLERLRAVVSLTGNVTVMPVALGDREGEVAFQQSEDSLGAASRVIADDRKVQESALTVAVTTADIVVRAGAAPYPNVVKIDTEGYELDVLRGMQDCLAEATLRVLCIEVHFAQLAERGMKSAPAEIERILVAAGFHCTWPDASHIVASRG